MTQIVLDSMMQAELRKTREIVMLYDDTGTLLGHFVPALDSSRSQTLQPTISDEEIRRRRNAHGGRPLKEILADLESKT